MQRKQPRPGRDGPNGLFWAWLGCVLMALEVVFAAPWFIGAPVFLAVLLLPLFVVRNHP